MAYILRRKVFVCYSHQDRDELQLLREHICSAGLGWEPWDDSEIPSGTDWQKTIEATLREARAAVLLVSASFLASKFIQERELPLLLRQSKNDRFRLIPVQVRTTLPVHPLSHIQFLNDPNSPVSDMERSEKERLWARLAEQLLGEEPVEEGKDPQYAQKLVDDEAATGQVQMRAITRKLLKALVEFQAEVRGKELAQGLIAYKVLFHRAGLEFVRRWAGVYLYEIHEWCRANAWPPLNALVVNAALGRPGGSYPGGDWEGEAQECLNFKYPAKVLSPP
jgi:hypothetical protein